MTQSYDPNAYKKIAKGHWLEIGRKQDVFICKIMSYRKILYAKSDKRRKEKHFWIFVGFFFYFFGFLCFYIYIVRI
jgi:hypothetical protein